MFEICSGAYLFKGVISDKDQEGLVDYYLYDQDKFYTPVLRSGHKMSLKTNCYGWHWNAKTYKYSKTRDDVDQEPVQGYPLGFDHILKPLAQACFPQHEPKWDICICNHYKIGQSRLGLHRDNSESEATMATGHPVVSLSVGASCIFEIGPTKSDTHRVRLDGGDAILFGGPGRMLYHGVVKVLDDDYPNRELFGFKIGRLNFTFRKI